MTVEADPDPTGKRRQRYRTVRAPKTRDGKRQAEAALAEFVVEVEAERGRADPSDFTVAEYLESWVARRSIDWAPSTRTSHPGHLRRHVVPHIGDQLLTELRRRDVADLHATLLAKGLAAASVQRIHSVLRSALAEAVRLELLDVNPCTGVRPPKAPKSELRPPTDDELDRILGAAKDDPGFLTLLRLDAILGARRGELAALRWSDIDFTEGTVRVARAISLGPDGPEERATKTGAVTPTALDDGTLAELRAHRKRRLEQAMAAGVRMDEEGFVFVEDRHPAGDRPLRPDGITYRFAKARKAADVEGVRLHDVRHYVASMLLAAGVDILAVAQRLGHASPKMTLDVYGHLLPAADRRAADILAARRQRSG